MVAMPGEVGVLDTKVVVDEAIEAVEAAEGKPVAIVDALTAVALR